MVLTSTQYNFVACAKRGVRVRQKRVCYPFFGWVDDHHFSPRQILLCTGDAAKQIGITLQHVQIGQNKSSVQIRLPHFPPHVPSNKNLVPTNLPFRNRPDPAQR